MDLGERGDIHPPNKQEVGRRLARAARAQAYGGKEPASGPEIARAVRSGADIVLHFIGVTGRLSTWSSPRVAALELCGETQESCRWADGVADGATVRIRADGRPATRVRYGWGESPVTNLYDEAGLPAGPFEVPIG
jgi:sialate O-acetylesterase